MLAEERVGVSLGDGVRSRNLLTRHPQLACSAALNWNDATPAACLKRNYSTLALRCPEDEQARRLSLRDKYSTQMVQAARRTTATSLALIPKFNARQPNDRVDRAARIHSSSAEPMMMQNSQPPLRSNELLGVSLHAGYFHTLVTHLNSEKRPQPISRTAIKNIAIQKL
jgi:hypothetical protein